MPRVGKPLVLVQLSDLAEIGPLRPFLLDSTIPEADHGELGRGQLDWLETSLADAPEQSALLVMHHPPIRTGVAAFDTLGLSEPARAELGQITARHPQVHASLATSPAVRIGAGCLHSARRAGGVRGS